jgi:transformation/transcription domain-associated protein
MKYVIGSCASCLQEAFVKIREQAKAYLEIKGELTSGLNLIDGTNLEYFPVKHKAEIIRLRGDFLWKLNDSEGANLAYSNAISLFKNLPKGWISWGNYCDMVYVFICLHCNLCCQVLVFVTDLLSGF